MTGNCPGSIVVTTLDFNDLFVRGSYLLSRTVESPGISFHISQIDQRIVQKISAPYDVCRNAYHPRCTGRAKNLQAV